MRSKIFNRSVYNLIGELDQVEETYKKDINELRSMVKALMSENKTHTRPKRQPIILLWNIVHSRRQFTQAFTGISRTKSSTINECSRTDDGEEMLVYGPLPREPDEKLYPWKYERKDSGVRKL
ncbi:unnamed protein product [Nippostrongylus brasiliensis]|uniref:RILP-like protein 1 (inferred by orthology to a human protein) n=1 Tax=Nippostrongylus brasiliensis TaxID=27835 RepID=A0A0N4YH82_NIPBR|nr:unnamed protein product [Nippostrongylus brasiliensis]